MHVHEHAGDPVRTRTLGRDTEGILDTGTIA